jgi:putative hydrolase of the HAD superfamily
VAASNIPYRETGSAAPFRAVIFDLGGVVLGSPLQVFAAFERELDLAPGALNRMIVANGPAGAWQRLERGEVAMEEFMVALDAEFAAIGARVSTSLLMQRIAVASQPRPIMVEAIRRLRAHGLLTAALTNNWVSEDQTDKMGRLRPEFDVFIESAREGMRKPDPRIYQLACARLGVEPAQAVFLDDIGANLKSARALGMATIKVVDEFDALRELEALVGLALST